MRLPATDNLLVCQVEQLLKSHMIDCVVISPGPGRPDVPADFGVCADILTQPIMATVPVLGVCLGVQGLVTQYGGTVSRAALPMHGRVSRVWYETQGQSVTPASDICNGDHTCPLFAGVPQV